MTKDLLDNWLFAGISRDSIISLLGAPYSEGITPRLPKGLIPPDSISTLNFINESKAIQEQKLKEFNDWFQRYSQLDTIMLYPVGWSMIDPNFLAIKLNIDSTASDFWVEQH